jgi:hypothetical protein
VIDGTLSLVDSILRYQLLSFSPFLFTWMNAKQAPVMNVPSINAKIGQG